MGFLGTWPQPSYIKKVIGTVLSRVLRKRRHTKFCKKLSSGVKFADTKQRAGSTN